jgi:hypothetical protein
MKGWRLHPAGHQRPGGQIMTTIRIESLTARIAISPKGERKVMVKAVCWGPADLCAVSSLRPRQHISAPTDGMWNLDLVTNLKVQDLAAFERRELFFTGEADWCQGVRLHGEGLVLEHRLAPNEVLDRRPAAAPVLRPPSPQPRRAAALRSPWLDPDRAPMIIPAGRPVPRVLQRSWRHLHPTQALA